MRRTQSWGHLLASVRSFSVCLSYYLNLANISARGCWVSGEIELPSLDVQEVPHASVVYDTSIKKYVQAMLKYTSVVMFSCSLYYRIHLKADFLLGVRSFFNGFLYKSVYLQKLCELIGN